MNYYLLIIWGDCEPELESQFNSEEECNNRAKEIRETEVDEYGLFILNSNDEIEINTFTGGFEG